MINKEFKLGLMPDEKDDRDFTAETLGIKPSQADKTIELDLPELVYHQGKTDMCSAFAATMMMSIINKTSVEFSQGDLYAQKTTPGEGAQLRDVMKRLFYRGVAPMMLYNHVGTFEECKRAYQRNKDKADYMAQLGRIRHYYRAKTKEDVVAALEKELPMIAGLFVHDNFKPDNNNHIPLPSGKLKGGHAVLIVGYKPGYVKILNSWGRSWGNNGCAWVPFEMMFDIWVPVDASLKIQSIYFQIGNKSYYKNGVEHKMDVAPFIKDDRTFVPLKYAAESLDAEVEWIPAVQGIGLKR